MRVLFSHRYVQYVGKLPSTQISSITHEEVQVGRFGCHILYETLFSSLVSYYSDAFMHANVFCHVLGDSGG